MRKAIKYRLRKMNMRKTGVVLLAVLMMLLIALTPVFAKDSTVRNRVDVVLPTADMQFIKKMTGRVINNTTFVPLSDFVTVMGGSAGTDGKKYYVKAEGLEIELKEGNYYIIANGHYIYTREKIILENGEMSVPIRPLCAAFGADVLWSQSEGKVYVMPTGVPIKTGVSYSEEDLYWMSKIIYAEAGNEPFEGQIAVGNVIMNRLRSTGFPDTVKGVIFDNSAGIQFSPAYSGGINKTPGADSIAAAAIALENKADIVGDSLFFSATMKCWAGRNREVSYTVGHHIFFF